MSTDYSRDCVLASGTFTPTTTGAKHGEYIWSKSYNYLCKTLTVVPTTTNHYETTLILQASSTAGSFSSPTVLATLVLAAASTILVPQEVRVADSLQKLQPGQLVRIWMTTGTTEDTAVLEYKVYGCVGHE